MKQGMEVVIRETVREMTDTLQREEAFSPKQGRKLPNRSEIIELLHLLRKVMFPGYFDTLEAEPMVMEFYLGSQMNQIYTRLERQLSSAFTYQTEDVAGRAEIEERVQGVCQYFIRELPVVQKQLLKDMEAAFEGDPAAKSTEGIIFSYPGLFATFVYRIAHVLYMENIPFIPRIMTEYAHSKTGIDIHAGATIGEYFFIDHGTGVVIGETCQIGNHVKIYQGVTLGALSTRDGQKLAGLKRHPTVEDDVTIYAGATVLGGKTVIGRGTVIGGNAFITQSVGENARVQGCIS